MEIIFQAHHQNLHLRGVVCPYKCPHNCDKTYFKRWLLNNHIKKMHTQVATNPIKPEGIIGLQHTNDTAENKYSRNPTTLLPPIIIGLKRGKKRGSRKNILPTKVVGHDVDLGTNPSGRKKERPVGYYPKFPIALDAYTEILNAGSPFACPLCRKRFKQRTSFDNHLYSRCSGKPYIVLEEHRPKYTEENFRMRCLFNGCEKTFKFR